MLSATSQYAESSDDTHRWPGFRGLGECQATVKELPLAWEENKNIKWSIDLPGFGQSSPVVWDGRVFVTSSAGDMKETLIVKCLDLADGKEFWTRKFDTSQKIKRNKNNSQCAPTPAVDANRLIAFFESGDLIALDHDGKKLWSRSLSKEYGAFSESHGIASSVAQTDNSIILLIAHKGPSYLISIDKKSGANNWKVDQP
jgi:outer membrane protein assembly factor BamB